MHRSAFDSNWKLLHQFYTSCSHSASIFLPFLISQSCHLFTSSSPPSYFIHFLHFILFFSVSLSNKSFHFPFSPIISPFLSFFFLLPPHKSFHFWLHRWRDGGRMCCHGDGLSLTRVDAALQTRQDLHKHTLNTHSCTQGVYIHT